MKTMICITIYASILFLTGCAEKTAPRQTALYTSGKDGYHTYRIPAIVVTTQGTILAFCEGRKGGRGDSGDIDLLIKRSEDGGETWSEQQVIWDDGKNVCGNPCPVVDEETGTIWLLSTWNDGDDHEGDIISKQAADTRRVFVLSSDDDGMSWSDPVEMSDTTKDPDWGWYATGPGHAIQLKHGPNKGRLVIPCDHSYDDPEGNVRNGPYEYGSHIIYSDDHGATWKLGGVARPKVNECTVVELADGKGTLLLNMRSYYGRHRRTHAISVDGGMHWSTPVDVPDLIEPVCQASILRFENGGPDGEDCIIFSNPASEKREKLTIKMSLDEGITWPISRVLNEGPSAYSDLAISSDNRICCLYERGRENPYETITFTCFDSNWFNGE